ncbi:MAG: endonuclease/exonuclease/phosphatase family protein [Alphaproteobacteria bacterium]|nr:endonuclease/exonuclease/phosphatase family protein [Alphaproteobacteria bacterium]
MNALLLLLACASKGPPADLGALAADQAVLAETPTLAHLAAATGARTVQDLYAAEGQDWAQAPDPTAYLAGTLRENPERPHPEALELRVLTYNVALLDARLFRLIPYKASPYLDERRPELPDLILSEGYDVLFLQEVWSKGDVARFEAAAEAHGYVAFTGPRKKYNDGLVTLVKEELVSASASVELYAQNYTERDASEAFPGVNIKRGFVAVTLDHPAYGSLSLYNTHMQAWASKWLMRASEARELGTHIAENTPADGLAFVGGDFNGGPHYGQETWTTPEGEVQDYWWDNTLSYFLMAYYSGASDLWLRGAHPTTVLNDIGLPRTVINDPVKGLEVPHVDPEWCPEHRLELFTASDCDLMYFQQYAATENPARMDLLWARDPDKRVYVQDIDLAFSDRVIFGDLEPMEPSDHIGVGATLRIAPPE